MISKRFFAEETFRTSRKDRDSVAAHDTLILARPAWY